MNDGNTRQVDIAKLFNKSQGWVSLMQTRSIDPMPRDMAGATTWGRRLGLLGDVSNTQTPSTPVEQLAVAESVGPVSSLELEERRLKSLRGDEIQLRIELQSGRLMRRDEVDQRDVVNAAEFRRAACEYPLRARAVIERHIPESATVDAIMTDLAPLAAELLNRCDPMGALKGKTVDEIRVILLARVDELCKTLA